MEINESIAALYPQIMISAASGFCFGVTTSLSRSIIPTISVFAKDGQGGDRNYPSILKSAVRTGMLTALLWMLIVYPLSTTGEMTNDDINQMMIFVALWSTVMSPFIEIAFALVPNITR